MCMWCAYLSAVISNVSIPKVNRVAVEPVRSLVVYTFASISLV